jgi:hypothetical protein
MLDWHRVAVSGLAVGYRLQLDVKQVDEATVERFLRQVVSRVRPTENGCVNTCACD